MTNALFYPAMNAELSTITIPIELPMRPRKFASAAWTCCAMLLITDSSFAEDVVREQPGIRVAIMGEPRPIIELEVRQAPLGQVIDELASKTGMRVHYSVLPEDEVTATCVGDSVKQVLECLIGTRADFVVRYPTPASSDEAGLASPEVWILGSSFELEPRKSDTQRAKFCVRAEERGATGDSKPSSSGAMVKPRNISALLEMVRSGDPIQRLEGLTNLIVEGRVGDERVHGVLETAIADDDPSVRAKAVYGLARLGGPRSLDVLATALHDVDASVRLVAVESLDNQAEGVALLRTALADSDEAVRGLAAAKLETLLMD